MGFTEEEIAFFNYGFFFICAKCDALYSDKCTWLLNNVENTFKIYNSPFDKLKTVKTTSRKERKALTEDIIHKVHI